VFSIFYVTKITYQSLTWRNPLGKIAKKTVWRGAFL